MKIFYNIIYKIDNSKKLILKCNRINCNKLHKNFFKKINITKQKILELNKKYYERIIKIEKSKLKRKKYKILELKVEKEIKIREIEKKTLKSKEVILLKRCSFKECNKLYKIGTKEIKNLVRRICIYNINKIRNKKFIKGCQLFSKLYIKILNESKYKNNLTYEDFKKIENIVKRKYNIIDPFSLYPLPIYYR
tara:strand:+ start:62 stop:640 length:579 start_codon:yes stop_codon:yes gene_type:complete